MREQIKNLIIQAYNVEGVNINTFVDNLNRNCNLTEANEVDPTNPTTIAFFNGLKSYVNRDNKLEENSLDKYLTGQGKFSQVLEFIKDLLQKIANAFRSEKNKVASAKGMRQEFANISTKEEEASQGSQHSQRVASQRSASQGSQHSQRSASQGSQHSQRVASQGSQHSQRVASQGSQHSQRSI